LKSQLNSGFFWTFIDSVFLKGIGYISQLILANLLGPESFGIMSILIVFYALANSILDSGFTSSLIRTQNADQRDYSTIFYTNLIFAFSIYLILFFCAPLLANFYNKPILVNIIRIYSLGLIISGLSMVQMSILVKEMAFKKITILNILGVTIGTTTGLLLAYYNYGVWSLVIMYLTTQFINSLCYWVFSFWKPKMIFDINKLKKHFNYGYKLTISGIINVFFGNLYAPIIAKFYPFSHAGLYERAYGLNQYPVSIFSSVISKVTFPYMTKFQDDTIKLKLFYKQIMSLTFFIIAPLILTTGALAKPIFEILFTQEWQGAIVFFQIICFSSILFPLQLFNVNILKLKGKTNIFLKLEIIKVTIILSILAITYTFGIKFILYGMVLSSYISFLLNAKYCGKEIQYTTLNQVKDLLPTLLLSSSVFILLYYFINHLELNNYIKVLGGFFIGVIFYLIFAFLFKFPQIKFILNYFKKF
jgi:O-antigen/teichoic acid export membrane protein